MWPYNGNSVIARKSFTTDLFSSNRAFLDVLWHAVTVIQNWNVCVCEAGYVEADKAKTSCDLFYNICLSFKKCDPYHPMFL